MANANGSIGRFNSTTPLPVRISAVSGDIETVGALALSSGRWPQELQEMAIDSKTAKRLFGDSSPLGAELALANCDVGLAWKVVGVLEEGSGEGLETGIRVQDRVFIDQSAASLLDVDAWSSSIFMRVSSPSALEAAAKAIQVTLSYPEMSRSGFLIWNSAAGISSARRLLTSYYLPILVAAYIVTLLNHLVRCVTSAAELREANLVSGGRTTRFPALPFVSAPLMGFVLAYLVGQLISTTQGVMELGADAWLFGLAVPLSMVVLCTWLAEKKRVATIDPVMP